jgi:YhcH/YjgK/YiaL family protein
MIYDKLENLKIYGSSLAWDCASSFLKSINESSEEKRYELEHGIYAIIMGYKTKNTEEAVLEAHNRHVDIQMSLLGAEVIECFDRNELIVKEPYSMDRDVIFFNYPQKPLIICKNKPGFFTMLWPNDAHMPQLKCDEHEWVKKVVIKIPIELL